MTVNIEDIIFDWDGTLGMTLHLWLDGYSSALNQLGYSFTDSEVVREFFYEHEKGQLKYPEIHFPKLIENATSHVHSNIQNLQMYDGAIKAIAELHAQGIRLSLVSGSKKYLLMKGLSLFGVEQYFSSIISGCDVSRVKPDPEAFNQTLKNLNARAETTLVIGDARSDIIAGKAAKVQTCLFMPFENQVFYDFNELLESKPDYTTSSHLELLKFVSSDFQVNK